METKKQTAGRDSLGEFAPKFAQLNDDVLFGLGSENSAYAKYFVGKVT